METDSTKTTWKAKIKELNAKGFTNLEISKMLNTTPRHILKLSNRYNIKANKFRHIEVDLELRQFLLGSFLGDGCIQMSSLKSKNARLQITHGEKQTDYNLWKLHFLQSKGIITVMRNYTGKDPRLKKEIYTNNILRTESNPIFNEYCDQYTPKKTINYEFLKDLGAFGLAVWFMDDGFVTKNSFQISSCSFSNEEITILQKILKKNFNINTNKNGVNEIYIVAESREKFLSIITPYIIPSLKYKLIPYAKRVQLKQGELLEHPYGQSAAELKQ